MEALIVLSLFVGLAAASLRWGYDSRFGLGEPLFDEVEAHLRDLRQQALVEGLLRATRRPAHPLHRRALASLGVMMTALGHRLEGYGERVAVASRFAATSDSTIQSGL